MFQLLILRQKNFLPIFPPLEYGASRSTTLIPVSNTSCSTLISVNSGASAWIGKTLQNKVLGKLNRIRNLTCKQN